MEDIAGYARVLARARVGQQVHKPFLGKPYLKYGQCHWIWSYFFQLGAILGAKYAGNLEVFGNAFLGHTGTAGAVERYYSDAAETIVGAVDESMNFFDYVGNEFMGRVGYAGDHHSYLMKHGLDRIPPNTAEELAWQYADLGAALGSMNPDIIRSMFELQHAPRSKEEWDWARAAGLDLPPEQDIMTYEEIEEAENGVFIVYCQQCCPVLHTLLLS